MKLLHTSDWHLGMSVQARSLEEDQRFFLRKPEHTVLNSGRQDHGTGFKFTARIKIQSTLFR